MKVFKDSISRFLSLIKLKGDLETIETVFNIDKKNITTVTKSQNNVLALKGNLKGDFEKLGEIGIGNVGLLQDLVNSFITLALYVIIAKFTTDG